MSCIALLNQLLIRENKTFIFDGKLPSFFIKNCHKLAKLTYLIDKEENRINSGQEKLKKRGNNMKKVKKTLAIILAVLSFASIFMAYVSAESKENPVKSKYYHDVESTAIISSSGVLTASNYYSISGSGFTSAKIETYVEKRVMGIFWTKVNNGQPNNTWVAYPTATVYMKDYTLQLSSTGTYRVTATYTFYGSNGSETVTRQPTATY